MQNFNRTGSPHTWSSLMVLLGESCTTVEATPENQNMVYKRKTLQIVEQYKYIY